jgi:hypothetical protein
MINLLPSDTKREIRAAHTNVVLVKCLIFTLLAVFFLTAACFTTYILINKATQHSNNTTSVDNSRDASYDSIKSQADAIDMTMSTAKSILDQQISYSDIVMGIATSLPSGVIMDTLTLDESSFNAPVSLQLYTASASIEPTIKASFQKSSLFQNYTLDNITSSSNTTTGYPVQINIRVSLQRKVSQ